MPGIVGLITKMPREQAEAELLKMVSTLRHESTYTTGTWSDERLGVYVGWSALKDSFSDGMPITSERGDLVMIFSGEEYPEPGAAAWCAGNGNGQKPSRPTYLVRRYEEEPTFPVGLNGLFHGIVADLTHGRVALFNDRYGMHRLYYHESSTAFYFAAEAKAILSVRPELRSADAQGLGELVACGCVLENRTLFKGIQVLAPGSNWTFSRGIIERKGSYFRPQEWEEQPQVDTESYYEQLRGVFASHLTRYMNGRQAVGMSLTGGLDTRMIMAWQKSPAGTLPCYSFGGMFRDCEDVILARKVAAKCGQPHQVVRVGDEFLSRFSHYAERTVYLTDGCADVSFAPVLYVNEQASRIAPVRLTGNYGGEVLRRVRAFKPRRPAAGVFRSDFLPYIEGAAKTYDQQLAAHPLSFAVFRQAPWHHYGLRALEQTQLSLRSPYLDNDFVQTLFRAPASALKSNDICLRLISDGNPVLTNIRTDRGIGGNSGALNAAAKRKLLDFTVKAEYAYDYGMPHWVSRVDHAFALLHMERLFLGRHKFYHFRVWYRDALSAYVREMLLDGRTLSRPYLERNSVEAMVLGHLKGNRNFTAEIHKVLTLELVQRLFLDSN